MDITALIDAAPTPAKQRAAGQTKPTGESLTGVVAFSITAEPAAPPILTGPTTPIMGPAQDMSDAEIEQPDTLNTGPERDEGTAPQLELSSVLPDESRGVGPTQPDEQFDDSAEEMPALPPNMTLANIASPHRSPVPHHFEQSSGPEDIRDGRAKQGQVEPASTSPDMAPQRSGPAKDITQNPVSRMQFQHPPSADVTNELPHGKANHTSDQSVPTGLQPPASPNIKLVNSETSQRFGAPTNIAMAENDAMQAQDGLSVPQHFSSTLRGSVAPHVMSGPHISETVSAQAVAGQIIGRLSRMEPGRFELRLDPPELGRVLIQMQIRDGDVIAVVTTERAETADLMRRHTDILARELGRAGLGNADLSFRSQADQQSNPQPDQRALLRQATAPLGHAEPLSNAPAHMPARLAEAGSLDIRL